jgi:DNA-binding transcriptional LysR family regulator
LNLERMRILHAIDAYGSVTAAAEVLHVTTSAISQQMAKLERETGLRLLERNGRGVRLTDAADLLVEHADRMLALVEQAESELAAHRGVVAGRLTIAAFATAARGLAPPALRELSHRYPDLRVELDEREPDEALPLVARGDVDVAIVQDWFNDPLSLPDGLRKAPLLDDLVDIAVASGHPLAGRETVDLDELADESWISWSRGQICSDWLVHTFRARGMEPRVVHTAAEHPTQLALVAAGLGTAVIPRLGRDPVPAGVHFVQVRPQLSRHVYAVWRSNADRRPAIRALVEALRATAEEIGPQEGAPSV